MSCFKKHSIVFDTVLRRTVKIKSLIKESAGIWERHAYQVQGDGHENECVCCDLRVLDDSPAGKFNRKVVEQVERLLATLR